MKMWKMHQLTLEGRRTIFISLAISKILHLALTNSISVENIDLLSKIQESFFWKKSKPKIKHETCKSYKHGDLKNVNIFKKIASL